MAEKPLSIDELLAELMAETKGFGSNTESEISAGSDGSDSAREVEISSNLEVQTSEAQNPIESNMAQGILPDFQALWDERAEIEVEPSVTTEWGTMPMQDEQKIDLPAQKIEPADEWTITPKEWDFAPGPEAASNKASESEPAPDTPAKKFFRVLHNVLFWLVCLGLIGGSTMFALSTDPQKNYFGYRLYTVLTSSMAPKADGSSPPGGFDKGSIIFVKMCEADEIKVGDIITFNPNPGDLEEGKAFLTHRVIDIKSELNGKKGLWFIAQGDANPSEDPPISAEMLIGKKTAHIPGVGKFLQNVRKHFVLAVIVVVCFFGSLIVLKYYFSKPEDGEEPKEEKPKKSGKRAKA